MTLQWLNNNWIYLDVVYLIFLFILVSVRTSLRHINMSTPRGYSVLTQGLINPLINKSIKSK